MRAGLFIRPGHLPAGPRRSVVMVPGGTATQIGLALLLIRIAETITGTIWAKIADELDLLTLGTFTVPAGTDRGKNTLWGL